MIGLKSRGNRKWLCNNIEVCVCVCVCGPAVFDRSQLKGKTEDTRRRMRSFVGLTFPYGLPFNYLIGADPACTREELVLLVSDPAGAE